MENKENIQELQELHQEAVASHISLTENFAHISGFTQQLYEAAETIVGAEGPRKIPLEASHDQFEGAEGHDHQDPELPPSEEPGVQQDDSEGSLGEAAALPLETHQNKVQETFLGDRVRELCQHPNTWRVIKSLIVIAVAIKLYQSLDTIEQYIPIRSIDWNSVKSFFNRN